MMKNKSQRTNKEESRWRFKIIVADEKNSNKSKLEVFASPEPDVSGLLCLLPGNN